MSAAPTLSRVSLVVRPVRGATREYLTHQLVADLFGDRPDRGYLYRVTRERPEHGGARVEALVLSADPPQPDVGRRPWGDVVAVESKPFAPPLAPGQVLDFEIRLNATAVVTGADGTKRRTDVWDAVFAADRNDPRSPHDVYGEYLRRKLAPTAEVLAARVDARGQVRMRRAGSRAPITIIAANVIGTLRMADPEPFLATVASGIGRSKAFGCGLLCLSRPGTVLYRRRRVVIEEQ